MTFSPDGRRIASGGRDNTVRVWDTQSGQELLCLGGHEDTVESVAFSSDGRRIASGAGDSMFRGGRDNTVRVWDAHTGQELLCLRGHKAGVFSVAFSPDGRSIFSAALDGTVRVWDADTGICIHMIQGYGHASAIAAGASVFCWSATKGTLETLIQSDTTRKAVAWLPASLSQINTHPAGRTWAGAGGNHLYLFTLEGNASPTSEQEYNHDQELPLLRAQ